LLLCYYALGNKENMKKGFIQLLNIQEELDDHQESKLKLKVDEKKNEFNVNRVDDLNEMLKIR